MVWQQWVLVAWFLFSLPVNWYMVGRPRKPATVAVAFQATIALAIMAILVVTI
jgi:hypothetical protein